MRSLLAVLMKRDGYSRDEALEMIAEAKEMVLEHGRDPEEVLMDEFGLEGDYIFDLLD
jgi:predicted RNase H-like HicB family nuclease